MYALGCTGRAIMLIAIIVNAVHVQAADMTTNRHHDQTHAVQDIAWELADGGRDRTVEHRVARGDRINIAFVTLTGEAINPLFGVTAAGVFRYFRTDAEHRDSLPVYERPIVWLPLLAVILLMAFNSTICGIAPFMNTPLNILGNIVNTAGAVVVLPLVVSVFANSFAVPAGEYMAAVAGGADPISYASEASGSGSIWLTLGWIAGIIIAVFSYVAVWLTAYTVDVLVLLSPWAVVDAILKSLRLAVMAFLAILNQLSPGAAIAVAALIVVASTCFSFIAIDLFAKTWRFIYRRVFGRSSATASAIAGQVTASSSRAD